MARGKKTEKTLTQEEKLHQALVPESEWPYRVPENWRWTYFGSITNNYDFKRIPLSTKQRAHLNKVFDYYGASGVIDKVDDYIFDQELLLIGEDGANLLYRSSDIAFLAVGKYWVNNHAHVIDTMACSRDFLRRFVNSIDLAPFVTGSAQPKLTQAKLNSIPVPLPPLPEQQRIVDRIESLFAKLDEAKEKAQTVVDGFEDRKAAILHKAFTGEMTEGWRRKEGFTRLTWGSLPFGELSEDVRLGLVRGKAEQGVDKQYGYLKMNNITMDGLVDLNGLVRVDATPDEAVNFSLVPGDFLFNTRNSFELVGKNAVWQYPDIRDMLFNNNIMRVRFQERILPQFVSYYLNSEAGKHELEKVKKNTTNIAAIYAKDLNKIRIPLPTIEEQQQICLIVNSIIMKLQGTRGMAERVIAQIDTMKKSILARAFRGELGTNDPSDESAEELLKRIL